MRRADQLSIESGKSGFALMSAAGREVYALVCELCSTTDRILVACGSGNNGGDGFVAAKLLVDAGFDVSVAMMGAADSLQGDAHTAFKALGLPVRSLFEARPSDYDTIVDAILGTGIDRPVCGTLAQWVADANACGALIVSVDIPSGISGDGGEVMGNAIEAEHTVTFFRKKTGQMLFPGRHHCGTVHVGQIGIEPTVLDTLQPSFFENHVSLWQDLVPTVTWHSHKYTRGHTIAVTGDAISTGAARLAARAALRAGAGLVTLAGPTASMNTLAAHVTCEMLRVADTAEELENTLADERITSVVLGPGMGVGLHTRTMVRSALNSMATVVMDADALTSFENCMDELKALIFAAKGDVVLTPHWGEFRRLFGDLFNTDVSAIPTVNKIQLAAEAASMCGATVVLKGADTVVANHEGVCVVNTNAPPWLATAGSGDVLAGTIAGLSAQGVEGFYAACIGCWMHGEAARKFGPGLIATDISEQYPQIHRQLAGIALDQCPSPPASPH